MPEPQTNSTAIAGSSPVPCSPSSGEIAVIEWAARKFAVVKTNVNGFQILRCKHEGISGGLQLIYTTRKKAEEVAAWIRENSEAIIPENDKAETPL